MNRTLGTKMLVRIWGSTMILFLGVYLTGSYYSKKEVIRGVEDESKNLAQYYTEKYEGRFGQAEKIAGMIALNVALHPFGNEEDLKRFMKGVMQINPEIYGTCIAFEPGAFEPGSALFAPYFHFEGGEPVFVQLGTEQYNYFAWDWYKVPMGTGRPEWTEPYFDTGGGETIMITYSTPIVREGRAIGVATVDIGLGGLAREINGIRVLQSGYAFIVSKKGHFISYPDSSMIMKSGLDKLDPELAGKMIAADSGFMDRNDPFRKKRSWIVYYPIRTAGLSLAIVYPFQEVMARVFAFEKTAIWFGLIGLFALMLIVALVSRSIARPIVDLASAVHKVAAGNLDFQIPPNSSPDEVGELTRTFNKMIQDLRYHMEELKKSTAEKERIASELDIAYRIQKSILPCNFGTFSEAPGFEIFARSIPAREVGGDFYDFFSLDKDRIGFLIGDVSGKGIPAAMFMAVCRTFLKATALTGIPPGGCLARVNSLLMPENEMLMFLTVFYGTLNVSTGEIQYANAGHNPPYLLPGKGSMSLLKDEPQLALGVMDGIEYVTRGTRLEPGDSIFLYTDGITEAADSRGEFYANTRMESALAAVDRASPEAVVSQVFQKVETFTGPAEQADDITALSLLYTGPAQVETRLRLANRLEEIERMHHMLAAFRDEFGLPESAAAAASLALEEILTNIIQYAFKAGTEHFIEVRLEADRIDDLRIRVEDDGTPFNPLLVEPADVHATLEERPIGGLGIHLARKLMDEIDYRYSDGKNILTLIKRAKA